MKTYLDCIPCFFNQALEASRISGAGVKLQKKVLNALAKELPEFSLTSSPPEMGRIIYGLVRKMTRRKDPYSEIKKKSNKLALSVYGRLEKKVSSSRDKLLTAVELAVSGNIIDYGVKNSLDVHSEITKILNEENKAIKREKKAVFNYSRFKAELKRADTVLYLSDNAGEVVFDRILIEEIKKIYKDKRIIYAVKEKPIINDALYEDAVFCGIDRSAEIVSSGLDSPGTVLKLCSKSFLSMYNKADMVISKGQGNFEALSNTKRPVFFLFMVKCPVIARHIDCKLGAVILSYHSGQNW